MSTWFFKSGKSSTSLSGLTTRSYTCFFWFMRGVLCVVFFLFELQVKANTNPSSSLVQPPREMVDSLQWSKVLDKSPSKKGRDLASQPPFQQLSVVSVQPEHPVVIIHTDEGFIPSRLFLKPNREYLFYLVNVSQQHRLAHYLFDGLGNRGKMEFGEVVKLKVRVLVNHEFLLHCPESGKTVVLNFDDKF